MKDTHLGTKLVNIRKPGNPWEVFVASGEHVGKAKNFEPRVLPYDLVNETKKAVMFNLRCNEDINYVQGLRWLKNGGVCVTFVCNENSQTIISNPAVFAQSIPVDIQDKIFEKLEEFLPMNPVNRQSTKSVHFDSYNHVVRTVVNPQEFMNSLISGFFETGYTLYHIGSLISATQQLPQLFLEAIGRETAQTGFGINISHLGGNLVVDKTIENWSVKQLAIFVAHCLAEADNNSILFLERNLLKGRTVDRWDIVKLARRQWILAYKIHPSINRQVISLEKSRDFL